MRTHLKKYLFNSSTIQLFLSILIICLLGSCSKKQDSSTSERPKTAQEIEVDNLNEKSHLSFNNNVNEIIVFARKAANLAKSINYKEGQVEASLNLSNGYFVTNEPDSAIFYVNVSLDQMSGLQMRMKEGEALHLLANIYCFKQEFERAATYYQKSLNIGLEISDSIGIMENYIMMSYMYTATCSKEQTQDYIDKAFFWANANKDTARLAYLNLVASGYCKNEDPLTNAKNALSFYQVIEDAHGIATAKKVLADFIVETKAEEALTLFKESLYFFEQTKDTAQISDILLSISNAHLSWGAFQKALDYSEKVMELSKDKKGGDLDTYSGALMIRSRIYKEMGDYENALNTQSEAFYLADSINSIRREQDATEISEKFEATQKEQQIAEQSLALSQQRNLLLIISIAGLSILLLGFILFQFLTYRQKIQKQEAAQVLRAQEAEAQRLAELNRMKSTFLANITHELRTPLTLLLSPLKSMLDGDLKGDTTEYLQLMARNGMQLEDLINQLLNISRLEKNEWPDETKRVELWGHFRYLSNSFESYATRQQIQFDVNIPDHVLFVDLDLQKLEQIVLNILSNAFKYTAEGGRVFFKAQLSKENILEFTVKDTGKGIAEADIPQLFDRFFRVEGQAEGPQAGSGIGLALVKDLIDWFEGDIKVASVVGEGSTFTTSIPIKISENPLEEPIPLATPIVEGRGTEDKPVVLVVEDHPDVLKLLSEQLADAFVIQQASNGLEGLEKATEIVPDLIITDVMMPKMDGRELCAKIKGQLGISHIPVIMLTALSQKEEKLKGLAAAADHYLSKPFQISELKLIIKNMLDLRANMGAFLKEKDVLAISKTTLPDAEKEFLDQLISLIESKLEQENYTVNQLAKEAGLSRSQLHRKLVALTNQTPSQFMRKLKLQHAKKMLETNKSVTVSEIAYACGFSSLSYFSRSFKEEFGYSPAQNR